MDGSKDTERLGYLVVVVARAYADKTTAGWPPKREFPTAFRFTLYCFLRDTHKTSAWPHCMQMHMLYHCSSSLFVFCVFLVLLFPTRAQIPSHVQRHQGVETVKLAIYWLPLPPNNHALYTTLVIKMWSFQWQTFYCVARTPTHCWVNQSLTERLGWQSLQSEECHILSFWAEPRLRCPKAHTSTA